MTFGERVNAVQRPMNSWCGTYDWVLCCLSLGSKTFRSMVEVMSDLRAETGDLEEASVSIGLPVGIEEEQMEYWACLKQTLRQWRLIANQWMTLTWEYMGRPVGVGNPPSSAQIWEAHLGVYHSFHFRSVNAYGK